MTLGPRVHPTQTTSASPMICNLIHVFIMRQQWCCAPCLEANQQLTACLVCLSIADPRASCLRKAERCL